MAIERWHPFGDLFSLQDRVNPLFSSHARDLADCDSRACRSNWAPSVDISEDGNNLYLEAELPGIKQSDIHVKLENQMLTLSGERKWEEEKKEENYHRVERTYGSFQRSFSVPAGIDAETVTAKYKDGLLKITLPKKPETKPREISVNLS